MKKTALRGTRPVPRRAAEELQWSIGRVHLALATACRS
jgi:hypothetical protein